MGVPLLIPRPYSNNIMRGSLLNKCALSSGHTFAELKAIHQLHTGGAYYIDVPYPEGTSLLSSRLYSNNI